MAMDQEARKPMDLARINASRRLKYAERKDSINARRRELYSQDPGRFLSANHVWQDKNREKTRELSRDYYRRNRASCSARRDEWAKNNPDKVRSYHTKKRAARIKRTASWDVELTNLVCSEASHLCRLREDVTGVRWSVDHIVPLQGRAVSGLHVWNNLRVITASENSKKNNRFEQ